MTCNVVILHKVKSFADISRSVFKDSENRPGSVSCGHQYICVSWEGFDIVLKPAVHVLVMLHLM